MAGSLHKSYHEILSLFDKDITVITQIHEIEKDAIYNEGYALLEQKKGKEVIVIYHIL